jgi:uncharacterized membrane protein
VNKIPHQSAAESGKRFVAVAAVLFFVISTWVSYAHWANFECRTFDLANYVQGIWQLLHGRFAVSVIGVPLLGNHVEPIVFLFAPLFAVFRHPMLFVAVQNAALATMGPVGYSIARRLGLDGKSSALAATALLLAPAAGYIALHEFHPEALSAPFLLLMLHARLARKLGKHWLWFIAVLACKENMALLLIAYCAVHCVAERKRGLAELRAWFLWPMTVAILWFVICAKIISPALNSGNVDYIALYDHLGASPSDILRNAITHPQLMANALVQSLTHGNLVWALLFPFLCLPLLRPRWLIVAVPILLQHLLSWRASEWTIYFHYSAPLLPLFWVAFAEAVASSNLWKRVSESIPRALPAAVIVACVVAQIFLGPAAAIGSTTADWFAKASDRARKNAFIANISPQASVVAPFPYLSHLAMREKLYSLHHILKGLKTLSHQVYEQPQPTDFVLIDYLDSATFDAASGYYHPTMKTADGRIVPSSDRLLHDFLRRTSWVVNSSDELALFRKAERTEASQAANPPPVFEIATDTQLISITKSVGVLSNHDSIEIRLDWRFQGEREVFPWMLLRLTRRGGGSVDFVTKGLCAPEAGDGPWEETWRITSINGLAPGDYSMEAIFVDNSKRAWSEATGQNNSVSTLLSKPVPLGDLKVVHDQN